MWLRDALPTASKSEIPISGLILQISGECVFTNLCLKGLKLLIHVPSGCILLWHYKGITFQHFTMLCFLSQDH